jgi:glycosyltransferase involved in cell wall biosynthesis
MCFSLEVVRTSISLIALLAIGLLWKEPISRRESNSLNKAFWDHQKPPRERVRIAIVIDRIFRWNGAGTERHLAQLLEVLDRDYYDPAVFTLELSSYPLPNELDFPVKTVPPGDTKQHVQLLVNLTAALRQFRPHIVQTFFRDATYLGPVAAWLVRTPFVVISKRDVGEPPRWWESPVLRVLGRSVDSWICNSPSVRDWVVAKSWAKFKRIEVLPNCIDLARFHPPSQVERRAARMKLGLPPEAPILVSVANLRPVKGLNTIIEAAHLVRTKLPGAQFYLIGEGPDSEELDAKIRTLDLSNTVSLVGAQCDVALWLKAADIGLLASFREGSSNALLEYIASGLPSVVSDIPPNRELIDGLFFPAGNAETLAQEIVRLWKQTEFRQQLGQDYRRRAIQFGQSVFAERVNRFYAELVGTRR